MDAAGELTAKPSFSFDSGRVVGGVRQLFKGKSQSVKAIERRSDAKRLKWR